MCLHTYIQYIDTLVYMYVRMYVTDGNVISPFGSDWLTGNAVSCDEVM